MQNQYDSSNKIQLSLIATVKNESATIAFFIESLLKQTLKPDEVIIVDGNSNDGRETWKVLAKQRFNFVRGNAHVGIGTQGYLINIKFHGLILLFLSLFIIWP